MPDSQTRGERPTLNEHEALTFALMLGALALGAAGVATLLKPGERWVRQLIGVLMILLALRLVPALWSVWREARRTLALLGPAYLTLRPRRVQAGEQVAVKLEASPASPPCRGVIRLSRKPARPLLLALLLPATRGEPVVEVPLALPSDPGLPLTGEVVVPDLGDAGWDWWAELELEFLDHRRWRHEVPLTRQS